MKPENLQDHPFTETLASYLDGLAELGLREVELCNPFPSQPVAAPPPRARQQPAPVPPVEPATEKPILPPPPKPKPVAEPASEKLVWCTLLRMAECEDNREASETTVVLVTAKEETVGPAGELLRQILHASGYALLSEPLALSHPEDIQNAGARILTMGNPALQKISPAGMDLKVVRGMWQTTPYGKLIPTFPPSLLPDNPAGKKAVWQDLKNLLKDLELEVPDWTRKKLQPKK